MIICFNKKINSLSEENLNFNYIQKIMSTLDDVKDHKCPYCNRKNALIKYGHYNRNISFLCENEIKNFYVQVQRVQCKSCKRTHALLPCFIIPYVIMASFSIAKIVANAVKSSAYQVCKLFSLPHQIIYTYIRIVLDFFMDFKILNNKKEYIKQRILIKYSPEDLSHAYIYNPKDKTLKKIEPVDKIANSKMKRENISYS